MKNLQNPRTASSGRIKTLGEREKKVREENAMNTNSGYYVLPAMPEGSGHTLEHSELKKILFWWWSQDSEDIATTKFCVGNIIQKDTVELLKHNAMQDNLY